MLATDLNAINRRLSLVIYAQSSYEALLERTELCKQSRKNLTLLQADEHPKVRGG